MREGRVERMEESVTCEAEIANGPVESFGHGYVPWGICGQEYVYYRSERERGRGVLLVIYQMVI